MGEESRVPVHVNDIIKVAQTVKVNPEDTIVKLLVLDRHTLRNPASESIEVNVAVGAREVIAAHHLQVFGCLAVHVDSCRVTAIGVESLLMG
ncbi:hypothetical protein E2C01_003975 [Portunus trituberculatus]|uniref:Uncharacterized protein n=1 Tax=Portunus trituberculatus TaxID=210409 RepID=A0A5B7CNN6_PORTR|nr:hypothetical protein [Portunus trituberculatus]